MKQKGFMFSLEVMIAIIILATAIGIVLSGNIPIRNEVSFTYYSNQSNRISSVYFNDPTTSTIPTDDLVVCGDLWKYELGSVAIKNICEGYS